MDSFFSVKTDNGVAYLPTFKTVISCVKEAFPQLGIEELKCFNCISMEKDTKIVVGFDELVITVVAGKQLLVSSYGFVIVFDYHKFQHTCTPVKSNK